MDERVYWLGFSVFPGIGPLRFRKLLNHFRSAKEIWHASLKDVSKLLGEKLSFEFDQFRKSFSVADYSKRLLVEKISYVIITDAQYPKLLSHIKNPPIVLYVRGSLNFDDSNHRTIAIVGTRRITEYGREVTESFTQELVGAGFIIVSGLAMGVDAVAHKTTLDNGGKTVAVLGCGVDYCSPRENQNLYDQILKKGGCIISEFPLGHGPTKGTFPSRNRIIAGLSVGVLVTEGAEDSGSLITADYAFKNNRNVFAVPGPITSQLSKGPYSLIKKGAKLVTSGEDIIKEFQISNNKSQISNKSKNTKFKTASKEEKIILELLENEPLHFDEIVKRTKLPSPKLSSILSIMEIKGLIKNSEGLLKLITSG